MVVFMMIEKSLDESLESLSQSSGCGCMGGDSRSALSVLDAQMQMDTGRYSSVTVSFGTCKSRSPNLGMIASEEDKKQLTWSIQFRHGQLRHVQIPVS
ncbi:hypothetical protein PGT21_018248 [Puccinia graminis f. sp. tritici]|uniref:Uncharacterized protein n=1 Tax=Puccinia graminis f. sp. tritici TaxID=56615 RepID=A0A5B0M3L5_PUCGR|nr:hypothetical protein PGT21_018248 [Puccinia graminis f. sp. tritici]